MSEVTHLNAIQTSDLHGAG